MEGDSLALVAIYCNNNGENWIYDETEYMLEQAYSIPNAGNPWLEGSINTWHGVTLTEDGCAIESLVINGLGVTGQIPEELNTLTNLKIFSCSGGFQYRNKLSFLPSIDNLTNIEYFICDNNVLRQLPNLTNLVNLKMLNCSNNRLNFSDLEPISSFLDGITCEAEVCVIYAPQHEAGIKKVGNFLTVDIGGMDNEHIWFKDGEEYSTSPELELTETGTYSYIGTNNIITNSNIIQQNLVFETPELIITDFEGLAGTYCVGAEGGEFMSIEKIVDSLTQVGVAGAVIFDFKGESS